MGNVLILIGLILDIIGVIILFIHGPPISPILPDGSEMLWGESTEERKTLAQKKIRFSKIALGLIVFGFMLQLITPGYKVYKSIMIGEEIAINKSIDNQKINAEKPQAKPKVKKDGSLHLCWPPMLGPSAGVASPSSFNIFVASKKVL
ncbi:MAG: hypothetical protein GY820_07215 [Gammaproteobacteria bacterium]|nr:hypothetical protein [Gammaproteobacteria bacterium]